MTMDLQSWLRQNDDVVDWTYFSSLWDEMQLRHNPFRDTQADTLLYSAGIMEKDTPHVLDLGCGPGGLARRITKLKPNAMYCGIDTDPVVLAAARKLLSSVQDRFILADLRDPEWGVDAQRPFDSIISLTALHYLSKPHLKGVYARAYSLLREGGWMVVGDPYLPEEDIELRRLSSFQDALIAREKGPTWDEYWEKLFQRYPIEDAYKEYHRKGSNQKLFEGSDDGYPISFYSHSMREAGFSKVSVFLKIGLRVVYGGMKGD